MDSSLIDVDVQPMYVRVTLKGKSLQLALSEEVKPDSSTAKRSQVTGHLVITMPKAKPYIRPIVTNDNLSSEEKKKNESKVAVKAAFLEVDDKPSLKSELANIVSNRKQKSSVSGNRVIRVRERDNSPGFEDNLDVPPLE